MRGLVVVKYAVEPIVDRLYRIPLGFVNGFVIAVPGELTLVDCGLPGSEAEIGLALDALGFEFVDIRHILITHAHADHYGALAELQHRAPRSITYAAKEESELIRCGQALDPLHPLTATPGLHNYLAWRYFSARVPSKVPAARVDHVVHHGEQLKLAGGFTAVRTPGHTPGHTCYFWHQAGGVMFLGDAVCGVMGPRYSIAYQNFEQAKRSLCELAKYPFEYACFGHGRTLIRSADRQLAKSFSPQCDVTFVPAGNAG